VSSFSYAVNGCASLARLVNLYTAGGGETVIVFNFLVSVISNAVVLFAIHAYRSREKKD